VCGDGTVDTGEECDDGNKSRLDGCDSSCKYEVFTRMNTVTIMGGGNTSGPSFCVHTANALGNALSNTALNGAFGQDGMNQTLQKDITAGKTNVIVQALGLDDLTAVNDTSLQLGTSSGQPDPAKGAWPNANQIDWWYQLDSLTLDANNLPTSLISPAAIANRNLTAGPSTINLLLNLGGPALLGMSNAKIAAQFGTTTTTPAAPPQPGQLAANLKVFETLTATGNTQGLCGDVTVESLAQIPLPEMLAKGGSNACRTGCGGNTLEYTYCGANQPVSASCNSLLDALVGGCKATLCLPLIKPTQPDVDAGGAKPLVLGANNKVTTQTSGNKNGYSSWMKFSAQRVHATGKY